MTGAAKPRRCKDCGPESRRPAPHPGPRCATCHRAVRTARSTATHGRYIEATYGITEDQYADILAVQDGRCYICQRATGARRRLAVDHDHVSGEVRGLLCKPCNRDVLGHLRDSTDALFRAIEYLINPPARKVLHGRPGPDRR